MRGAAALEGAQADQIAYMDNAKYADALAATRAGVCLVSAKFAPGVPEGTVALVYEIRTGRMPRSSRGSTRGGATAVELRREGCPLTR